MRIRNAMLASVVAIIAVWACGGDSVTAVNAGPGEGALAVKLKDRPLWFDSVEAVNIFVVRIDARLAEADSAEAEVADDDSLLDAVRLESDSENHEGHAWITIATPDTAFNLLELQNGVTAFLGTAVVDTGNYRALRLVIDPGKSTIVLKDGTVLGGDASPFAKFPSGARSGIKIFLNHAIRIHEGEQTTVVVDFDLENSFVLRGNFARNGLLFKPVIRANVE